MDTLTRRDALGGAAALGMAVAAVSTAAAAGPQPDPHPLSDKRITRIAFGSCAEQTKDQPIWEAVLDAKPDLFLFLGDNVYIDSKDRAKYPAAYAELAAKPGFKRLRDQVPILAVWDDHDFGDNDQDARWPLKAYSREVFCDFWGEPAGSARRTREGVYAGYIFGPRGARVQVLLPDLRWNKTPNVPLDLGGKSYDAWAKEKEQAGQEVPGPYARNPDPAATQLGEAQWAWLEQQLRLPADIRIIGSSLQVLADFPGWEAWVNYARDHERLIETMRKTRASGVVFLSGDTHYGEITRLDRNVPYPLWDITSSGITEVWPVTPPNALRVGPVVREPNFGLLTLAWAGGRTTLTAEVRDGAGRPKLSQTLALSALRSA
jgi:alkaline phosphatase D